jgi:hypothetical protein
MPAAGLYGPPPGRVLGHIPWRPVSGFVGMMPTSWST